MKILRIHILRSFVLSAVFTFLYNSSFGQGRVVVNEFMAWSGCATTTEFIELMNFGPGPMNIGCYIVTNGTYAVTIPPNTILQPGQYYVLSGQDVIPKNCANVDSAITANLNWTTCNCTNAPIPTTGGFLKDGGSANEKVVLLDPNLNVVDAVIRDITKSSPSIPIVTKSLSGGCTSRTFNLGTMAISYEDIGSSTGVSNSFSRKVDGDCGWVKTTDISANAPNKTGSTASANYEFSTLSASECAGTAGKVSILVGASNVASLFPMNYMLGYDKDSNNVFTLADTYTYGVDSTAPSIDITNLPYGRYSITVGSSLGCNLKRFDFFIFNCYGIVLPLKLVSFKHTGIKDGQHVFECQVNGTDNLKTIVLESNEGGLYRPVQTLNAPFKKTDTVFTFRAPVSSTTEYRLRLVEKSGVVSYSPVVRTVLPNVSGTHQWPNPVKDKLFVQFTASRTEKLNYIIYNINGVAAAKGTVSVVPGTNTLSIDTDHLLSGIYQLQLSPITSGEPPIPFRFVK